LSIYGKSQRPSFYFPQFSASLNSHIKISYFERQSWAPLRCSGFATFCYGSRSTDPYLWLMDPPALFVSDLQDTKKCLVYFVYNFLKVHLHHS
jgi:hypothetical protein